MIKLPTRMFIIATRDYKSITSNIITKATNATVSHIATAWLYEDGELTYSESHWKYGTFKHNLPIAKLQAWKDEDPVNRVVKAVELRVPSSGVGHAHRKAEALAGGGIKYGKLQLLAILAHHRYGTPVSSRVDSAVCSTSGSILAHAAGEDFRTVHNQTFRAISPGACWVAALEAFVEVCHEISAAMCHCDIPDELAKLLQQPVTAASRFEGGGS